jgi:hypothetical protein
MLPIQFRAVYTMRAGKYRKYCKFSFTMPDANYSVQVTFNYDTGIDTGAITITDRTDSQCTVNIENALANDTSFSIFVYYFEASLS